MSLELMRLGSLHWNVAIVGSWERIYVSVVTTCLLDSFCRKRLFQMINDLPTIFEVVRTMMSMVALVALAETTSVQMSFGFAATSVRNGSMEDV